MVAEVFSIETNLPGILNILRDNLYSRPEISFREILQNSYDSCIRRKIEDKNNDFIPKITVKSDLDKKTIKISDNGSGLTKDELVKFIATIGKGYTNILRENFYNDKNTDDLIGEMGIGFLAGFLLAKKIEIKTKSFQTNESYRFKSNGGKTYFIEPCVKEDIGTECILYIKEELCFFLDDYELRLILAGYASFLNIPIYVNDSDIPINQEFPPWKKDKPTISDYRKFLKDWLNVEPLAVIPIKDVYDGDEKININGVLYIPEFPNTSSNEDGKLIVYIKNMFICSDEKELLPPWAKFVSGIIDCHNLIPTLSRESLIKDEEFGFIGSILEVRVLDYFRNYTNITKKILKNHNYIIKSYSINYEPFFREIKDLILFETNNGISSLKDYILYNNNRIHYYNNNLNNNIKIILNILDISVINIKNYLDQRFIEKYITYINENIKIESYESVICRKFEDMVFQPENDLQNYIIEYYLKKNIFAKLIKFPSDILPAYYYSDNFSKNILYINTTNLLINDYKKINQSLEIIYYFSKIFSGENFTNNDLLMISNSIAELLK